MGRRKLFLYGDADLDSEFEQYLRMHNWVNYEGARGLGLAGRSDRFHFREAFRKKRVLICHDDGYLAKSTYPLHRTNGVIVIRRGRDWTYAADAFERFVRAMWAPVFRDVVNVSILGYAKVSLSRDGFHLWGRTTDGQVFEEYHIFRFSGKRR
jgi:hypothetical protein